jgi:molecular chaperone Hsp33
VNDELLRALAADGSVSVRVLSATNLVRDAARRHGTSPAASVALARALMGGVLLATEGQDGEHVQVHFRGDGPFGSILVTATSDSGVRGYVQHPDADPPLRGESLGVSGGIGFGALTVERNHPSWKQPYSGVVPIVSGEIAQDLAQYLLESEQKPSAVALGVYLSPEGSIEVAGGYLVQALPGASDAALSEMERRVAQAPPAERLRAGDAPEDLLARLLDGVGFGAVERAEPRFTCPCDRERVRQAAALLGREELREVAVGDEPLEVRCAFCAETYQLSPDEVGGLLPDA